MHDRKNPLVHIGFPKCASTFLQNAVFPTVGGLYTEGSWQALSFDHFVLKDVADFDPASARIAFQAPAHSAGSVPVISNENLVGGAAARYDWMVPTADRLKRTYPDARVLIVVREQRSMALSLYQQLIKHGESVSLKRAIASTGAVGFYPRLRLERLRYDLAVQTYVERFGPEGVKVLPFEMLSADAPSFVRDVVNFSDAGEVGAMPALERQNVGFRGMTIDIRRRLNVVAAENYNGPGGPPLSFKLASKVSTWTDEVVPSAVHARRLAAHRELVADVVGDMFVESNRRLATMTGLDLRGLGYNVG